MTTLIYSKHMLFYFPLQIIIFWLQSFDKSLKPNFCASWPRSCDAKPGKVRTKHQRLARPKCEHFEMSFEIQKATDVAEWLWMIVRYELWVHDTPDFILFGATCCLRLQMKQKRSDRRAWTWFREEDLFWKQNDCRWSNHENWLSRIQKINVLLDFQNILREMAMDLKISLEKCLWSRCQVQVSRSSSGHLWEVRTIDTASTLFIEG